MKRLPIDAHLDEIRDRFKSADDRHHRASVLQDEGEMELAEKERQEALGDNYAAEWELADFFLKMLRYVIRHRLEAARSLLMDILESEFRLIVETLSQLKKHGGDDDKR